MNNTKELNDLLSAVRHFLKDWGDGVFALDDLEGDHANAIMEKMAALNNAESLEAGEERLAHHVDRFERAAIEWTRAPHPTTKRMRDEAALDVAYAAANWLKTRHAACCRHGKPKEGECAGCIEEGS